MTVKQAEKEEWWVIRISGDYGCFLYKGTEKEAEQRRQDKCRWEGAPGQKRRADQEEILSEKASYCLKHPGYNIRYSCDCEDCDKYDAQRIKKARSEVAERVRIRGELIRERYAEEEK